MAKPIELGLDLVGEDAREFRRYLESPHDDTEEGRRQLERAIHLARRIKL